MKNKLVATIISGAREYKAVSIEDLKGLSVPEQFELLQANGYQRGEVNLLIGTSMPEWLLITGADDGGYVYDGLVDLLSVEKCTIPFVLKDEHGTVIDEYNYSRLFFMDTDPARLIAECWIKGGKHEEVLTMPISADATSNGFYVVSDSSEDYILTSHDIKCFEEILAFYWSERAMILKLANGRFALGTHVASDGKSWSGFPVCGDGNEELYKNAIVRDLSHAGHGIEMIYEIGEHDSLTFPTREAAQAWADRIGLEINMDVA